ncbi:LysR family transcriptional regulator [Pseudaquabacterium rugosum]|uniref:LysR family transcriptional regulator n=1 Tax=Pseudaquabacterium rugosum TaxID=2984194 RepID=A0ABU9B862_9BURK
MDLNRLKALRELAQRGTMAAAAEALCITPSAVSQQIAQLEAEMDQPLTERQGRGVRLTPAGLALVAHTERILVVLDQARSELAQLRREIAGELRIAAFPSFAAAVLPTVVQTLRSAWPRLQIVLEEMEPPEGLAALGSWRADVAVVDDLSVALASGPHGRDGPGGPALLGHQALTTDTLHVLLPAGHALAGRPALGIADLADEDWALDSTSSAWGDFIAQLCRRAGYTPRLRARCRGFEMVSALVAAGTAVSIVPGLRLARPVAGTCSVPLAPAAQRQISVAFRQGERGHPAVQVVVQALVDASAQLRAAGA